MVLFNLFNRKKGFSLLNRKSVLFSLLKKSKSSSLLSKKNKSRGLLNKNKSVTLFNRKNNSITLLIKQTRNLLNITSQSVATQLQRYKLRKACFPSQRRTRLRSVWRMVQLQTPQKTIKCTLLAVCAVFVH